MLGILFVLFLLFFLSVNRAAILEQFLPADIPADVVEKIIDLPNDVALGDLCSDKFDCILFCKSNGHDCMNFCIDNPGNEICSAFEAEDFEAIPLESLLTKDL